MKTLWQSFAWQKLQTWSGHDVQRIKGVLVLKKQLPSQYNYLEIQRANKINDDTWQKILELAKKEQSIFIVVNHANFPEYTLLIDLQLSETEILKQMKQNGRRHIKQAVKQGITIGESLNIKKFAKMIAVTGQKQGFGVHNAAYFSKLLEVFKDKARLLVAKTKTGKWAAAGIFVFYGGTAT